MRSLLFLAATPMALAQKCSPLHFVYARATTEPPGGVDNATPEQFEAKAARIWSKGYGAAGKSMFGNITELIPSATGWPVHYPASWTGCASENKGIEDMLGQLTKMSKECPDQKYVIGGHSQGGVVTVRTIPKIPKEIQDRIIAVTMVGSPNCPAEVKEKCRSYCNKGDGICVEGGNSQSKGKCVTTKRSAAGFMTEVVDETPIIHEPLNYVKIEARQYVTGKLTPAICEEAEVAEKNHVAKGRGNAHLLYSSDGFFMPAAACFVYKRFKAAGGSV